MAEEATTPTPPGADVDPLDQMAELLGGGTLEDQPETETPTAELEAGEDDLDDDVEETEEPTAEGEAEVDEAEVDDVDEGDDDDRTLSQLMGLNDNQVSVNEETGEMTINTKVDGVTQSLNMKEVVAGYQTSKYNTQKSMALAEDRKTFEAAAGKKAHEVKQQLDLNAALTQKLQGELMKEFQGTNWDELRQIDPAEYAARQQDQSVRYNQLQQIQQQIQQHYGQTNQQQQDQNTEEQGKALAQQRDVMISNNPSWHDPAVMKSDVAEIRQFLTNDYGLSEQEISMIGDAKAIGIIQDAMAYRKGAPIAKKKLAAVPKMQKSKGVKRKKASKLDKLTNAAKLATGSRKRELQTDAIAELLGGG